MLVCGGGEGEGDDGGVSESEVSKDVGEGEGDKNGRTVERRCLCLAGEGLEVQRED